MQNVPLKPLAPNVWLSRMDNKDDMCALENVVLRKRHRRRGSSLAGSIMHMWIHYIRQSFLRTYVHDSTVTHHTILFSIERVKEKQHNRYRHAINKCGSFAARCSRDVKRVAMKNHLIPFCIWIGAHVTHITRLLRKGTICAIHNCKHLAHLN